MYILLHETSHIVDYVCSVTPFIEFTIKELFNKKQVQTQFTKGVWDTYFTPIDTYDINLRSELTFYGLNGGPKINPA